MDRFFRAFAKETRAGKLHLPRSALTIHASKSHLSRRSAMATTRRTWNVVFSGAILATLAFGGTQAFASTPAESDQLFCSQTACRRYCEDTCPPWAGSCFGYCEYDTDPAGHCQCVYS
jgi:hypothetical protein